MNTFPPSPMPKPGEWITIDGGMPALVFSASEDGELEVGYLQPPLDKAIKEPVVWKEQGWRFKYSGPNGLHLRGPDEARVRAGPPSRY